MITLIEYINPSLSFVNFIEDFDKEELNPYRLKEFYTPNEIRTLFSDYGFYMDQADVSVGYTIKIYSNAFIPGMLTEAKIGITVFPSEFPHFIEITFEIPNNGGTKKFDSTSLNPNEELWDACRKAWNEATIPEYQKNIARSQGYEFPL